MPAVRAAVRGRRRSRPADLRRGAAARGRAAGGRVRLGAHVVRAHGSGGPAGAGGAAGADGKELQALGGARALRVPRELLLRPPAVGVGRAGAEAGSQGGGGGRQGGAARGGALAAAAAACAGGREGAAEARGGPEAGPRRGAAAVRGAQVRRGAAAARQRRAGRGRRRRQLAGLRAAEPLVDPLHGGGPSADEARQVLPADAGDDDLLVFCWCSCWCSC